MNFQEIKTFLEAHEEGVRVEYKREIVHVPKSVSAMANTLGGTIFYGVEADQQGRVTGIPEIPAQTGLKDRITDACYLSLSLKLARSIRTGLSARCAAWQQQSILFDRGVTAPFRTGCGAFRVGLRRLLRTLSLVGTILNSMNSATFYRQETCGKDRPSRQETPSNIYFSPPSSTSLGVL